MLDWDGNEIRTVKSAGGVFALENVWQNVIRPEGLPWPPPELVQKIYQSRQIRAFRGSDEAKAIGMLGFYSDLQSLHSEDAITWSVFGPVVYAMPETRVNFARTLLALIDVPTDSISMTNLWLWRRLPHPDTLVSGGPEIDFGLQTDDAFVIGEAKWLSPLGVGQGAGHDKDQIMLRREFCDKYGRRVLPTCNHFVVLGVSLAGGIIERADTEVQGVTVHARDTTWKDVVGLEAHPLAAEGAYLSWNQNYSRIVALTSPRAKQNRPLIAIRHAALRRLGPVVRALAAAHRRVRRGRTRNTSMTSRHPIRPGPLCSSSLVR